VTQRTPNVFLVGAGPVATALAGGLRLGGVPVLGLWARKAAAARAAGAVAGVASYSSAPPDLLLEADAVIVAVRDDAIAEVSDLLLATGMVSRRHVMLHCSGAFAAHEAFAAIADRVGGMATMHPLRAIADARQVMRELAGTVFGIEGDERGRAMARLLVGAVGGKPLELEGQQMAAYHAAAAMASNYLVALIDAAAQLLAAGGVGEAVALAALLPLAEGAVANVRRRGLADGLTGPIRRGDQATVARHLAALPAELAPLYRQLGLRTLAIARRLGEAEAADLDAIEALLASPGVTNGIVRPALAKR
jgi:predicted short-subunit dehydrogenase-like oxidoreductase (DUF2520 family)